MQAISRLSNLPANGFVKTTGGNGTLAVDLGPYVPQSFTINGHALAGNITVTASDLGLGNVENTALSTWAGTSNIVTLGTISTGTWHGTAIADSYIASAATWNAKQNALIAGTDYLAPNGNGSALTGLTKAQVGLGNVDNTSDATKNAAAVTLTNHTISGASKYAHRAGS